MIERVTLAPCGHLPVHLKYEKATRTINCELCVKHSKQARAEVLAACIQMGKDWQQLSINQFAQKYKVDTDDLPTALATLQPAAAALEVLLQKERGEAELEKLHHCIAMCLIYEHEPDGFDSLITHLRADEEKARAILDKS